MVLRHPKLRIYFENAGYPFLADAIALMYHYAQVYADVSTITWLIPAQFVRALLKRRQALPDRVVITGGDTEVHVSHYSVRCRWRPR